MSLRCDAFLPVLLCGLSLLFESWVDLGCERIHLLGMVRAGWGGVQGGAEVGEGPLELGRWPGPGSLRDLVCVLQCPPLGPCCAPNGG